PSPQVREPLLPKIRGSSPLGSFQAPRRGHGGRLKLNAAGRIFENTRAACGSQASDILIGF
ncbi:hypothetical protein, partial [Rhizobium leguminosarum]